MTEQNNPDYELLCWLVAEADRHEQLYAHHRGDKMAEAFHSINATMCRKAAECIDDLRAKLKESYEPEWFSCDDYGGDYDYVADCCDLEAGKILQVDGAKSCGTYWIACIPTEWDEDNVPFSGEHKLFESKEEAQKAIDEVLKNRCRPRKDSHNDNATS